MHCTMADSSSGGRWKNGLVLDAEQGLKEMCDLAL